MNKKSVFALAALVVGITGCNSSSSSDNDSETPPPEVPSVHCEDMTNLYFCDDFTSGSLSNWQLLAQSDGEPDGSFDLPSGKNYLRFTAGSSGGEILLAQESILDLLPGNGNYFIEARMRPRQNSTTRNKQLFLMARYANAGNWFAGGLNVQNSTASTQVEVAISKEESIARPLQVKKPIELGTQGGEDGVWYTTRFEMIDDELTIYHDGENLGSVSDTTYTEPGNFGIWTNNRSFEIDYIKIGDPAIKPIQLTLDYPYSEWTAEAGSGDTLDVVVTAIQDDGETPDSFSVTSSDENVVYLTEIGNQITLTALNEGTASVVFVSGSDANISKSIDVTVSPGFTMPDGDYGDLRHVAFPAPSSVEQLPDTSLSLTFDNTPTLNNRGQVRIYRSSDDALIDTLKVAGDVNALGYADQSRKRYVNYNPVTLQGNTLSITPHNAILEYGETYYVAIGETVLSGAELNGQEFSGLGKEAGWNFTTRVNKPQSTELSVGNGELADFATLQGALNYAMQHATNGVVIDLDEGTFEELLFLRGANNVTIRGADRDNTVIQYANYESFNSGTGGSTEEEGSSPNGGRSVFLVESADMLTLTNLTLKNTHIRNNDLSNQAETIYFNNSSGRLVATDANFISEQDTLQLKGYAWFYNTLVAGNVDFIWGANLISLFEDSEIRTIGDSRHGSGVETEGGYVLQARTSTADAPGFVFLNSKFTHGEGPTGNTVAAGSTYFARSGGGNYYDNVVLINSKVDVHIAAVGWETENNPAPNPAEPSATAGWREFASTDLSGSLLDIDDRSEYSLQLTASEAEPYATREAVFSSIDWLPGAP